MDNMGTRKLDINCIGVICCGLFDTFCYGRTLFVYYFYWILVEEILLLWWKIGEIVTCVLEVLCD